MYCWAAIRPASIVAALSQPPCSDCKPYSPKTTRLPRVALPLIRPLWLFRCLTLLGIRAIGRFLKHALVDPNLNANVPLGSHGFRNSVVDVRPQGAERNRPGDLLFTTGHFRPAQAACQLDFDPLGARFHRLLHRTLHRPAEAGSLAELLANILSHELR